MVSLVDIVPQSRTVELSIGAVELRGLGLRHIADLLVRFPELRKLFADDAPALDVEAIIALAPDAVGAIVAEAAGEPEAAGTIADALPLDDLAECVEIVLALTMPNGIAPFMERLGRVLNGGVAGLSGRAAATNTPPPPNSLSHSDMLPAT